MWKYECDQNFITKGPISQTTQPTYMINNRYFDCTALVSTIAIILIFYVADLNVGKHWHKFV